nr:YqgE/AlgH family protein [uncultured Lacibacter sp.]
MIEPASGILLISDPFLKDPNFMRTVVLLCEHDEAGSFGLVINRTFEQTLDQLIADLDGHTVPVYYGGPVQMDTLHFLHQLPNEIPGGQEITKGIYWGGDFEMVMSMLKDETLDLNKIRFYLGYSGWSNGQLNDEMKEKSWLTVNASRNLVFHKQTDAIWNEAVKSMGGQYGQLINYPIDPQLN